MSFPAPQPVSQVIDEEEHQLSILWTLLSFNIVFVAGRLYIRKFIRKNLGWDDWLIALGLITNVLFVVFNTVGTYHGLELDKHDAKPYQYTEVMKWMKSYSIAIIISPVLIKLSVCLAILRLIARTYPVLHIFVWIVMTVLVLNGLATFLFQVLECIPLEKAWNRALPGRCATPLQAKWICAVYGSDIGFLGLSSSTLGSSGISYRLDDRLFADVLVTMLGLVQGSEIASSRLQHLPSFLEKRHVWATLTGVSHSFPEVEANG
ncbi:MAG: hypothetical protein Q9159_005241 [Coniocarpon cinnabarinum]